MVVISSHPVLTTNAKWGFAKMAAAWKESNIERIRAKNRVWQRKAKYGLSDVQLRAEFAVHNRAAALSDKLIARSGANGRSLTQEIELLLERALRDDVIEAQLKEIRELLLARAAGDSL